MAFEIPMIQVPSQRVSAAIGAVELRLTVSRHPRDGNWYIDVESPAGTIIASGRRLVSGKSAVGRGLLPWSLECLPKAAGASELGPVPWGPNGTHRLVYGAR